MSDLAVTIKLTVEHVDTTAYITFKPYLGYDEAIRIQMIDPTYNPPLIIQSDNYRIFDDPVTADRHRHVHRLGAPQPGEVYWEHQDKPSAYTFQMLGLMEYSWCVKNKRKLYIGVN